MYVELVEPIANLFCRCKVFTHELSKLVSNHIEVVNVMMVCVFCYSISQFYSVHILGINNVKALSDLNEYTCILYPYKYLFKWKTNFGLYLSPL